MRPTAWLARILWIYGDGAIIDGLGPDGVSARVIAITKRAVRFQTGYRLPIRFRHAPRRGGYRQLFRLSLPRGFVQDMKDWPILTTIMLLPVVGAFLLAVLRGNDEAATEECALDRALDDAHHLRALAWSFSSSSIRLHSGFQFVEHRPWLQQHDLLLRRRRWPFAALRDPHDLPDAHFDPRKLDLHHRAREGVYDRVPAARNAHDRRVRARSISCCSTCSSRAA